MITVIGGIKGGGGKTTLATNLTVMRAKEKKVLLVDADEQMSASDWASQRESLEIASNWVTIKLSGQAIHTELKKMQEDYDDIIIDVGGRDTRSQRSALAVAHLCLIPFKPKSFDIWTIGMVNSLINEIKPFNPNLKVMTVINQADSRGSDNENANEIIREIGDFICLDTTIGYRKAFANASAEGLGVVEMTKGDPKAISEMQELYNHIYNM